MHQATSLTLSIFNENTHFSLFLPETNRLAYSCDSGREPASNHYYAVFE
jgi:hypothetical protein